MRSALIDVRVRVRVIEPPAAASRGSERFGSCVCVYVRIRVLNVYRALQLLCTQVHRDLKAENLLLDSHKNLKLAGALRFHTPYSSRSRS